MSFFAGYIRFICSSALSLCLLCASCSNRAPVIGQQFVDSLYHYYIPDSLLASNERELFFWHDRIRPGSADNISEAKYASGLINKFSLTGNIDYLNAADSVFKKIDTAFGHSLSAPLMSLVSLSIMHHRFSAANYFFNKACELGIKIYQQNILGFDVAFESGRYSEAAVYLKRVKSFGDYNYYFRRSKYDHLEGNTDSATSDLEHAVALAGTNSYLQNLAWSGLGDLLLHQGNSMASANALQQAIRINPADLHSILNLGWIALVYNEDTLQAGKLFQLALTRSRLPDPYYKLYQMAQWRHDTSQAISFAEQFEQSATSLKYENMYCKYLIELYTTVLQQPQKAETLSYTELSNRATPQTYTWYAYALLCNNKKEKAYQVFKEQVAGKPIEGTELYYAGKILKAAGHGFDAGRCFDAALQNRFDLSPFMLEDIRKLQSE